MGAMTVHYDVIGAERVTHRFMGMRYRALNFKPVLMSMAMQMRAISADLFETAGQSGESGGWDELAPSTLAKKAREGYPPAILIATSDLEASLTEEGAAGHVEIVTEDELIFGTSLTDDDGFPYPAAHQTGTDRMPARPVIDFTEQHRKNFTREVQAYMVGTESGLMRSMGGGNIPFGLA